MSTTPHDGSAPNHAYRLYTAGYGLYARDGAGKAVRLGAVSERDGVLGYRLEVDDLQAEGFLTSEKLLQDVAAKLAYASLHRFFGTAAATPIQEGEADLPCLLLENEEPGEYPPAGSAAE